jgi:hypothetical protein
MKLVVGIESANIEIPLWNPSTEEDPPGSHHFHHSKLKNKMTVVPKKLSIASCCGGALF